MRQASTKGSFTEKQLLHIMALKGLTITTAISPVLVFSVKR